MAKKGEVWGWARRADHEDQLAGSRGPAKCIWPASQGPTQDSIGGKYWGKCGTKGG